mmetsp:Transcript_53529/g.120670  ORF Transcript_53529/g.120670 Transcript_53529/m.120670 type:complete len:247 (-) Transcript_53529:353-1093(-)
MISTTRLDALPSKMEATHTSATRSRETSPEFSVSSFDTTRLPDGAEALRPPGRTMVKSRPESRRYFSATSFSSSTPPKAFVIWKPALLSWPQARAFVRIEDTSTTFLTPAFFAASTNAMVPRLSTRWASLPISKGLPGTKPVATMRASAPLMVPTIESTLSLATSSFFSATPLVLTASTCSSMAPRTVSEELASAFSAFAMSRTPPTTLTPPALLSCSTMRRPVCPVAPATTTVLAAEASASAAEA